MTRITYQIVRHDGGWAYRVHGVYSETFPSRESAHKAAARAAAEQKVAGETTGIVYEGEDGRWYETLSEGDDRPETEVQD